MDTKDPKLGSSRLPPASAPESELHIQYFKNQTVLPPFPASFTTSITYPSMVAWHELIKVTPSSFLVYKAFLQPLLDLPWEETLLPLMQMKNQRLSTLNTPPEESPQ